MPEIKAKDDETHLFEDNTKLVYFVIKKYYSKAKRNNYYNDLVQEGLLGLLHASKKYDPNLGKFSVYAVYWIRQRILRFLKNNSLIKVPEHVKEHDNYRWNNYSNYEDLEKTTEEPDMDDLLINKNKIDIIMMDLTEKEKELLKYYFKFYGNYTMREYRSKFGYKTSQAVQNRVKWILNKLRRKYKKLSPAEYINWENILETSC